MKNRGITLISLVVTIIILIILVGISISMILGNEGLLNKAKYATESYSNAQQQEEIDIAKYSNDINSYVNGNRDTVTIPKEEYDILKNANSYSTDEKEIGTWIDGKTIYQKNVTYTFTAATQSKNIKNFANITNGDTLIELYGHLLDSNGFTACFYPTYSNQFRICI